MSSFCKYFNVIANAHHRWNSYEQTHSFCFYGPLCCNHHRLAHQYFFSALLYSIEALSIRLYTPILLLIYVFFCVILTPFFKEKTIRIKWHTNFRRKLLQIISYRVIFLIDSTFSAIKYTKTVKVTDLNEHLTNRSMKYCYRRFDYAKHKKDANDTTRSPLTTSILRSSRASINTINLHSPTVFAFYYLHSFSAR